MCNKKVRLKSLERRLLELGRRHLFKGIIVIVVGITILSETTIVPTELSTSLMTELKISCIDFFKLLKAVRSIEKMGNLFQLVL